MTQIEVSLPPDNAVLLWLRQEHQGKTTEEYARWLLERPVAALPRNRVARQVMGAIQVAMKGQDPFRIWQAVRQAHMETDFLILLVFGTNSLVLDQSRSVFIRILGLITMISNGVLKDRSDDLEAGLREAAAELFALSVAVERIQDRFFQDECILAKDVREDLDLRLMFLRNFIAGLDQELKEDGHPELVIDSEEFRSVVEDKASKKVLYIRALAKSEMLQDFGRGEAARGVMRPYILGDQ